MDCVSEQEAFGKKGIDLLPLQRWKNKAGTRSSDVTMNAMLETFGRP